MVGRRRTKKEIATSDPIETRFRPLKNQRELRKTKPPQKSHRAQWMFRPKGRTRPATAEEVRKTKPPQKSRRVQWMFRPKGRTRPATAKEVRKTKPPQKSRRVHW